MAQHQKPTTKEGTEVEGADSFRRVNITIREDQYAMVHEKGLSLSPLVRDLLDDRFSASKVIIHLSPTGKKLYDQLVGSLGIQDVDLEPFLFEAIDKYLDVRLSQVDELRKKLREQGGSKKR